jgi:hypothetical protein
VLDLRHRHRPSRDCGRDSGRQLGRSRASGQLREQARARRAYADPAGRGGRAESGNRLGDALAHCKWDGEHAGCERLQAAAQPPAGAEE